MLVLSRKVSERILIGENIELVVVQIKGDQVKIGVNAPRDMPVHRKEIADSIADQKKHFAQMSPAWDVEV